MEFPWPELLRDEGFGRIQKPQLASMLIADRPEDLPLPIVAPLVTNIFIFFCQIESKARC